MTLSWPEGRWLPTVRPYTPVSSSGWSSLPLPSVPYRIAPPSLLGLCPLTDDGALVDEPGYLDLLVKRYPDGKASTYLHSLVPGQSLRFLAALRGHQWEANSYPHVTLIAGGAGITPIYQLAQGILNNPDDKTAITAVFGVNGDQDILFRKEFDQFEKQFPGRFKAIYTVSQPDKASPYRKGYVNKQLLQEVAPSPIGRDTKVFVCGPPAMEAALVGSKSAPGVLEQLGYRKDQIHRF